MNRFRLLVFIVVSSVFFSLSEALGSTVSSPDTSFMGDTINMPDSLVRIIFTDNQEVIALSPADSSRASKFRAKKRIVAILAFPFPFGLLGLHRVFLGTRPYIPFVYIGTLGGCFLILPIIDFVAILSANEEEFRKFENNPRVFMWSH